MKIITGQKGKLKGLKVLLRLDLNVPLEDGRIRDNFKIEKIITTIGFLKREGAKIIILSHIGRSGLDSLTPVCEYLKKFFAIDFAGDIFNDNVEGAISKMRAGEIIMLENLRQYEGEKNNELRFAEKLASLGDLYVNDAFAVSHRPHASIVGLPKLLDSYFGPLFERELEELKRISLSARPRLFVLGGDKSKTKMSFARKFLEMADFVFVGGALANDFFKSRGFETGKSLVSGEDFNGRDWLENERIILPVDVIVESGRGVLTKKPNEVLPDERIEDAGPETVLRLKKIIGNSKFVLWNGPLGDCPRGFSDATFEFIRALAEGKAEVIVGGGDTEHCISKLGLEEKFDFISTGGGALLEFVATGTLAGIEAIEGGSPTSELRRTNL